MRNELLRNKNRILLSISLIIFGVLSRLTLYNYLPNTPHIYFNLNGITQPLFMLDLFFIIAVISFISGLLLGSYYTFLIPLSVMILSDLIIGNTAIFLFTWSGFLILGLIGYKLKSKTSLKIRNIPLFLGSGIAGVLLYDLWTNFGCWLGWYPHSYTGLITCYSVALPFMFWHLLSTTTLLAIVLTPLILLRKHGLLKREVRSYPLEKPLAVIVPVTFMIFAILSIMT